MTSVAMPVIMPVRGDVFGELDSFPEAVEVETKVVVQVMCGVLHAGEKPVVVRIGVKETDT